MAGVYTEYTSLLHDMGTAIVAAGRFWINFIDSSETNWFCCILSQEVVAWTAVSTFTFNKQTKNK